MIKLINSKEKGFTLVEILIALSIMSIIMVAIASKVGTGGDVWEMEGEHTELMQNATIGLDKITRELKQASEITAISGPSNTNGFVAFNYADGTSNSFRFNNNVADPNYRYIEEEEAGNWHRLAGPLDPTTGVVFKCYDHTGAMPVKNLGGDSLDLTSKNCEDIKLIDISIETKKPTGTIKVPVSSKVSVGDDLDQHFDPFKFAIFGNQGVTISNQLWIGVHPSPRYPVVDSPANVGSFRQDGLSLQNVKIFGDVIVYGKVDISNNSYVSGDVICGSYVLINNNCMVSGNVSSDWVDPPSPAKPEWAIELANGSYVGGYINYIDTTNGFKNDAGFAGPIYNAGVPDYIFSKDPLPQAFGFNPGVTDITTDANDIDDNGIADSPLLPGNYGNVDFTGSNNMKLVLSVDSISTGIGIYHFRKIDAKVLDLVITGIDADTGIWIFVEGDIKASGFNMSINNEFGNQPPFLTTGQYNENYNLWASKVYVELGGTIANKVDFNDPIKSRGIKGIWVGTFFASGKPPDYPNYGSIIIGDNDPKDGGAGMVIGALYARGLAGLANPGNNTSLNLPTITDNPNTIPDLIYVPSDPDNLPSTWDAFKPN